jgi:hypothetical protein
MNDEVWEKTLYCVLVLDDVRYSLRLAEAKSHLRLRLLEHDLRHPPAQA